MTSKVGDMIRIKPSCAYVSSTDPLTGIVCEANGDLRGVHAVSGEAQIDNPYFGWHRLSPGGAFWANNRDLEVID